MPSFTPSARLGHQKSPDRLSRLWYNGNMTNYVLRPYRRGFNRSIYASITNEINYQIAALRRQGRRPTLVRLGYAASIVYAWEHWADSISDAPKYHHGYKCKVPIRYKDPKVSGVVVE